jgi:alpha-N-arabinofuranosidase
MTADAVGADNGNGTYTNPAFLLPVSWTDDDWPLILPPGERVPLVAKSPAGAADKASDAAPLNGTLTWRDEFEDDALSPRWIMLREPSETWWKISSGKLEVTPRREALTGRGNPSFLGHRVQHAQFTASLVLDAPEQRRVSAGLAVFQNERRHYFLAVRRFGDSLRVELEQFNGRRQNVMESASLPVSDQVELWVKASDATCSFGYFDADGTSQTIVANADATMLTTEVAGGFVGATVGPHVRIDD